MFKRLSYESSIEWAPIVAFVLTFGVFCVFVVRAIRMRKRDADDLARLPLEGTLEEGHKTKPDLNHE